MDSEPGKYCKFVVTTGALVTQFVFPPTSTKEIMYELFEEMLLSQLNPSSLYESHPLAMPPVAMGTAVFSYIASFACKINSAPGTSCFNSGGIAIGRTVVCL